ncbi:MAG: PKD domain-containing protein, partial [Candidatus Bathyarchaeia archaeon]
DVYIPDTVGIWSVSASWGGDDTHEGASSSSTSFTVKKIYIPKISSSITCSVSPLTLVLGEQVTVTGSLNPLHTDKTITLTFIRPDYSTFTKRASARATQGGYSDIFTPDMVGMWSVSASWGGDATHKGASSSSTSFVVHVPPEAIFTYSPSTDLSVFSLITFSDTSTDLDGTIISWLWDFGDNTASSDQNLTHMYADKGIYLVTLTVIDNDGYVGDSSQSVIISNLPPIAAFTYSPERPMVEQEIVFTDLSEDPEGEILTYLWNFGDEATSTEKHPHHTYAAYGTYTVTLTVTDDEGATDIHSTSFTVTTLSTSITLSVLASELPIGGSVTVTGSISPPVSGVTVTLTYTNPNGSTFTRTSTANPGDYSDVYIPDTVGIWSVSASWGGDATHEGASSSSTSFIIKSLECLIATATYGSELSQNVQFLRGFRDNDVLNTFAGSNFMTVFNGFYYSFSPNVASVISSNEGLRGVSKVVLYPLMGILHLSSETFSLFSFNLELGIVMAGLVASVLIGVFYFLPVALLLSLVRKIKISAKIIRLIGLIWAGSFIMIFIAEVTKSPLMMMVSTGAFVLVTISAAMLTSLRIILKRLI